MRRIVFAVAIAALALGAVAGTSQAAPIAPLSGVAATDAGKLTQGNLTQGNLTQVYWHYHYRHCWWRHGYRHCW